MIIMTTIQLYRYQRENGKWTVSPVPHDGADTSLVRLVADAGMLLDNGEERTPCIDTYEPEAWSEVPDPDYVPEEPEEPEEEFQEGSEYE